jgi:hypothetical protein
MSTPSIFELLPNGRALLLLRDQEKTAGVGSGLATVGKGLIGFGVGTAAGIGTAEVINRVYHASTGKKLPTELLVPAASLLGAGMGLAYSMYKSKELEELQNALKARKHGTPGGVSGK